MNPPFRSYIADARPQETASRALDRPPDLFRAPTPETTRDSPPYREHGTPEPGAEAKDFSVEHALALDRAERALRRPERVDAEGRALHAVLAVALIALVLLFVFVTKLIRARRV